ncbi:MAG: hypothetical protein JOZ75_06525 [Candidatus Dormibacteraeota bacterium]|nr:hypothetical protein [Candidatus Dormibacteraeota bacterium]
MAISIVMAMMETCECCGRPTPVYRLSSVILDGRIARVCSRCVATEKERIQLPFAPREDQGAIQPSTSRDIW